jgi:transposase
MLSDDRSTAWEDAAIRRSSVARSWTWSRPGRPIAEVAQALGISAQSIYTWRRQDRIDKGLTPGLSSPEKEELAAARRRIAQLETELAITRRAAELLKEQAPPFDGSRPSK